MIVCVGLVFKAIARFRRPSPLWMGGPRWYDDALSATIYFFVATAFVVYLYRTWRQRADVWPAAGPVRWRDRRELRVVLYCVAASLLLRLPLGILTAMLAQSDPS